MFSINYPHLHERFEAAIETYAYSLGDQLHFQL